MAFIDPPYNIGIDYGSGRKADLLPPEQYLGMIQRVVQQLVAKLTKRGSLWVLIPEIWADQIGTILCDELPRRNRIIWRETFGQYGETRFPNGHRHLFWHVADEKQTPFFTDRIRVPSQRMLDGDPRAAGPRVPDDVWEIPRLVGTASERIAGLPCQLPEQLLERVIECSTSKGDLVLDAYAGTGTTLRVAQRLDRRYLGIEKEAATVHAIRERLRNEYQKALF